MIPKKFRRAKARARHVPGQMNKTEQEYDSLLESQIRSGEIVSFGFESIKLKLADKTFFTPDFFVEYATGEMVFHEVKAATSKGKVLCEDDARVKIKVAAQQYPQFGFVVAAKLPAKIGGGWKVEVIS